MLPWVCSVIDQRGRLPKGGQNVSDTLAFGSRATSLFLPHFDVIYDLLPGSSSNNDDDGHEDATCKVNSLFLELFLAYSITFNSSNVGKWFWSWILKDCIKVQKKKKRCCFVFPSSTKRENRMFHVVVAQRRLRNVQKSVQSFCFANLTLLLFLPFSLLWMTVVHCFHLFVCLFVCFSQ